jgi:hypothetical protein
LCLWQHLCRAPLPDKDREQAFPLVPIPMGDFFAPALVAPPVICQKPHEFVRRGR